MFMEIYIYIYMCVCVCVCVCLQIYMFSYLCYKCLNEKGNVVFLTLIMLRKYEMIMVSIVL